MATVENIKYYVGEPFPCWNCEQLIETFLDASMSVYDYKTERWITLTVSECFNCGSLFGLANFPKKEV